jgi:hypothetical protein
MGVAAERRTALELAVKVWGLDRDQRVFVQNAKAVEITRHGAILRGLASLREPGEVVGLQCGANKARFRVIWASPPGSGEAAEVAVIAIEPEKNIWDTAAEASAPAPQAGMPAPWDGVERRRYERFPCCGGAQIWAGSGEFQRWATVASISLGGCYLQTLDPLSIRSRMRLMLAVRQYSFAAVAEVVTSEPGTGMGLRFTFAPAGVLRQLTRELRSNTPHAAIASAPAVPAYS